MVQVAAAHSTIPPPRAAAVSPRHTLIPPPPPRRLRPPPPPPPRSGPVPRAPMTTIPGPDPVCSVARGPLHNFFMSSNRCIFVVQHVTIRTKDEGGNGEKKILYLQSSPIISQFHRPLCRNDLRRRLPLSRPRRRKGTNIPYFNSSSSSSSSSGLCRRCRTAAAPTTTTTSGGCGSCADACARRPTGRGWRRAWASLRAT